MHNRTAVNIFFLINGFIFANWAARIPLLKENYELDKSQVGMVLLAHSIGAFIAMPITGWLIQKFSSNRTSAWSAWMVPIFFMLIPWMTSFQSLLIPFLLLGAANGIMDVAMNAQAVDIEKAMRKPIMTFFHAMFSIGMVAGALSGGFFTSIQSSLALHLTIAGIFSLVLLIIASSYLFNDRSDFAPEGPMLVWPKGPVIGLGVIAFCCMVGEGAMADWSTLYMSEIAKAPLQIQTFGLTAFATTMTLGRIFGDRGRLSLGDRKMILTGSILALTGMGLILTLWHPWLVILGFGMVGLGLSNTVPIVYSLAGSLPGVSPGVGIAMATTIGYSGFMFGPPVIGFISDASSLHYGLGTLAILFLLMMFLVWYQYSVQKQSPN